MSKRKAQGMPIRRKSAEATAPEPKHAGGRPSGLDGLDLERVEAVASLGFVDREIAAILEIAESTLNRWKKDAKFWESIKRGKLKADLQVTKSLFERAKAGDTTAGIFWLKNRQRERWRDRHEVDHEGSVRTDGKLVIEVVETRG